ncbi:hypothetical protein [Ahrensia sp. 13_GOM-1096m]|uniref:hypothetical protein n=1 Tax=Ahrensia sp. 13_GOM-1096m TaxID=1380380 RepID=UPI000686386F|nr:hypothetical protein [Ahrensia sp. 13_GOM-1096m]
MKTPILSAVILCGLILSTSAAAIELCKGGNRAARKVTCLVDGDTGWEKGVKWRAKGWDTPEYAGHAECAREPAIAARATARLKQLMSGGYTIIWHGEKGGMKRDLVSIKLRNGRMAGDILLAERLAVKWPHKPRVWCNN